MLASSECRGICSQWLLIVFCSQNIEERPSVMMIKPQKLAVGWRKRLSICFTACYSLCIHKWKEDCCRTTCKEATVRNGTTDPKKQAMEREGNLSRSWPLRFKLWLQRVPWYGGIHVMDITSWRHDFRSTLPLVSQRWRRLPLWTPDLAHLQPSHSEWKSIAQHHIQAQGYSTLSFRGSRGRIISYPTHVSEHTRNCSLMLARSQCSVLREMRRNDCTFFEAEVPNGTIWIWKFVVPRNCENLEHLYWEYHWMDDPSEEYMDRYSTGESCRWKRWVVTKLGWLREEYVGVQ